MAYDADIDYGDAIKEAISNGASIDEIQSLYDARDEKMFDQGTTSQYQNDIPSYNTVQSVYQDANSAGWEGPISYNYIQAMQNSQFDKYANNIINKVNNGTWNGNDSYVAGSNLNKNDKYGNTVGGQPTSGNTSPVNLTPNTQTLASTAPQSSVQDLIKGYTDSLKKSKIAALDQARQKALGTFTGAENTIGQNAQDASNKAITQSQQGAANFAQYLRTRGLRKSGVAGQADIARNMGLQNAQTGIEKDKTSALNSLTNQKANIEAGYQADVASANNDTETEAMKLAIDQANKDIERQTANSNTAFNQSVTSAGLTGFYNPYSNVMIPQDVQSQLSPYSNDYDTLINSLPDSDPMKYWAKVARTQKIFNDPALLSKYGGDYMTADAKSAKIKQDADALDRQAKNQMNDIEYQKAKIELSNALQMASYAPAEAQSKIDLIRAQINAQNSSAANQNNRLAWEKDPNNPDNILKVKQGDALLTKGQQTEEDVLNKAMSMRTVKDPESPLTSMYSDKDIAYYVGNSGLSKESKVKILNQLHIDLKSIQ